MSQETQIQLFEKVKVRVVWDDEAEKYFFSVVDVIQVLTESVDGHLLESAEKQIVKGGE